MYKQSRAKGLERAVENYLKFLKLRFLRVENYRCFRCGQIQNSKAGGFPDFFVYSPIILAIECKTGSGRMNPAQKDVREAMEKAGIKYLLVRDNLDELIKYFEER